MADAYETGDAAWIAEALAIVARPKFVSMPLKTHRSHHQAKATSLALNDNP